ncbi:MAG TPA: cation diffusion facilitator family transporter [Polyangia bacterium]|nr:cation diffusion facilitator family transporter [Polyangia bacterium]
MSEHHGHHHEHSDVAARGSANPRRRLVAALALTATFMVVEVLAGFWSGSLALLSDAGHMLTDAGALGLAIWAQKLGERPRSDRKTFGYRRAEILAAAANNIVLGAAAVAVIVEAIRRFTAPHPIQGAPMLIVACVGLAINLLSAWILSRGAGHDLNLRAAAAHVAADAAGSVAAIVAAVLILTLGWTVSDPIASILISLLILVGAWRLLREATNVLMQGVPPGIDVSALERLAGETPGVREVHDLHVWSIVGDAPVITAHVVLEPGAHGVEVARDVGLRLEGATRGGHVTVQPEASPPGRELLSPEALTRPRG